jgi:hypothetical protein
VVRPSAPIPLVPNSYPTDLAPAHPSTRLQHGIRKPKVYTDGTVRYGLHASSGSPTIIIRLLLSVAVLNGWSIMRCLFQLFFTFVD